jgi:hypothetical protein
MKQRTLDDAELELKPMISGLSLTGPSLLTLMVKLPQLPSENETEPKTATSL